MGKITPYRNDLFSPIEEVFDSFFNEFFSEIRPQNLKSKSGYPKINCYRYKNNFIVTASVPGMLEEEIDITLSKPDNSAVSEPRLLKIAGSKTKENKPSGLIKYSFREIKQSSFERSFVLPEDVDVAAEPSASLENGLLTLKWPLLAAQKEPEVKKISINSSKTIEG